MFGQNSTKITCYCSAKRIKCKCRSLSILEEYMNYLITAEIAEKWGISCRRVVALCEKGRIPGAIQKGKIWLIPDDAEKPIDGRQVRYSNQKNG